MNSKNIITLWLGLQAPWEITGQLLDTDKTPNELRLTIQAGRGERYPCPVCGALSHAHDFKEMTWRHLNFFQHHCSITASSRSRFSGHAKAANSTCWSIRRP